MRCRAARELLCEAVIAVELEIVSIETDALVLLLQLRHKCRHAVEFLSSHFNVFSLPGCAHNVVDRFGVKEKSALFAVICQRGQVFQVIEIDSSVDLDRVMPEGPFDV